MELIGPENTEEISTHALREEGDPIPGQTMIRRSEFLPTPSARRATGLTGASNRRIPFLPTPSARRATGIEKGSVPFAFISTHALREEGDTWNTTQPTT